MRLEEFRIYYNQTLYPELRRMELRRKRLLGLLAFSILLLVLLTTFLIWVNLFVVAVSMALPVAFYISYLGFRIRHFRQTFKPRVIRLILDFIDEDTNIGTLTYRPKDHLSRATFLESRIFETPAPYFRGEDLISGSVGHTNFTFSELLVEEDSPVRNRKKTVFRGVLLKAYFPEEVSGQIQVWPRKHRQHLMRAIKAFTRQGGNPVDHEIMNDQFRDTFLTFALPGTHVAGILTEPMQAEIVTYQRLSGKEIYFSFQDRKIFAAVTEPKDLMEPYIFRSNLSFDLVREFFSDIHLLLKIVGEFDRTH